MKRSWFKIGLLVLVLIIIAVAAWFLMRSQAAEATCYGAMVYTEPNFGGTSACLTGKLIPEKEEYTTADLEALGIGDNSIASFKLSIGFYLFIFDDDSDATWAGFFSPTIQEVSDLSLITNYLPAGDNWGNRISRVSLSDYREVSLTTGGGQSQARINKGQSVVLYWTVNPSILDYCLATPTEPAWFNQDLENSHVEITPETSTTYTLSCAGVTKTVAVTVLDINLSSLEVHVDGPGKVVGEQIDCRRDSGTCNATYNNDATVNLSAIADSGSVFTRWGPGEELDFNCDGLVTEVDVSILSQFWQSGTVITTDLVAEKKSICLNLGNYLENLLNQGTSTVPVSLVTSVGSLISSNACTGTNPSGCSVTMDSNKSVLASFTTTISACSELTADIAGGDCEVNGADWSLMSSQWTEYGQILPTVCSELTADIAGGDCEVNGADWSLMSSQWTN